MATRPRRGADALALAAAISRVPWTAPASHAHLVPMRPDAVTDVAAVHAHPQLPALESAPRVLEEAPVPRSRFARFVQFGSLAAGVGFGIVSGAISRATGIAQSPSTSSGSSLPDTSSSLIFSRQNVERIVKRLSRMRGAALKIGQMLSIQDNKLAAPEIKEILRRVQDSANYMPQRQLEGVMSQELGPDWRSRFESFEMIPMAAASIGQVHRARLASGQHVAVKVQYPGVAESISSDLANLKSLLLLGNMLPQGLYLENTLRVAQIELDWECDYIREADSAERFHALLKKHGPLRFHVPNVFRMHSTKSVLTSEFVDGVPIDRIIALDQKTRNQIGEILFKLCMMELFVFRFMQTDPNWSNFLYDSRLQRVNLIDFGAAREFPKHFTDDYLKLLQASSRCDRDGCIEYSRKLGFLTGYESEAMNDAHVNSLLLLSQPFLNNAPKVYDFSQANSIADQVRAAIPVMLRERLTPPPDESYSLHRKLSGCFMLCTKIGAQVRCRDIFENISREYDNSTSY